MTNKGELNFTVEILPIPEERLLNWLKELDDFKKRFPNKWEEMLERK